MEEGSKKRLVGTAVVVLLLVIFLPMLLEEESVNPIPDSDLEIAEQPAFGEEFDPEVAEPTAEIFAPSAIPDLPQPDSYQAAVQESEQAEPTILPQPLQVEPPAALPSSERARRVEPKPEPVELKHVPKPEPPPISVVKAPPPAPVPAQAARQPKQNGPGWVIQVSSLTEKPRALSLERELRAKGFPVFIERAEVGGKLYHRVRIGPRSARQDIETMAAALFDKAGYKGQILRYP